MKRPRHDVHKNEQHDNNNDKELNQQEAIHDLVLETHFLRQVDHPHIIKLRGVSADVASAAAAAAAAVSDDDNAQLLIPRLDTGLSYFLVLDRLYDTLHTRIRQEWKPRLEHEYKKHKKAMRRQQLLSALHVPWPFRNRNNDNINKMSMSLSSTAFLRQRLQVALDLSAALGYLHNKRIWHRDIKPDNIGFDIRGHVKIFDFGLAKQQPKVNDSNDSELFLATQMTGTLRYMAPEVGLGQCYNAMCDSYSFVHVLWEMLTCQKPYLEFHDLRQKNHTTFKHFKNSVWIGNTRPPLAPPPPSSSSTQRPNNAKEQRQHNHDGLKTGGDGNSSSKTMMMKNLPKWTPLTQATMDILQGGWHKDVKHRWHMSTIKSKLQEEVLRLKRMEDQDTNHSHSNTAESEEQSCASIPSYNRRRSTFVFGGNVHHSNRSKNKNSWSSSNNNNKRHLIVTANDNNINADDATIATGTSTATYGGKNTRCLI